MQPSPNDRQTDGQTQTDTTAPQDPAQPLPNPRAERLCQYIASGISKPTAYAKAYPGRRSRKSATEAASRLYRREDIRNRLAFLESQKTNTQGEEQNTQGCGKANARLGNTRLTKPAQPVDGQPLNRELVRKMLLAALSSENPNSATVSAIRAAQDFIAQEQPADSKPGPETIADYLANGAPDNTDELPRIVAALCKAYRVTRERFATLCHLSTDAQTCDTSTIMRHSHEIPPKPHGDLSSNNNDLGL